MKIKSIENLPFPNDLGSPYKYQEHSIIKVSVNKNDEWNVFHFPLVYKVKFDSVMSVEHWNHLIESVSMWHANAPCENHYFNTLIMTNSKDSESIWSFSCIHLQKCRYKELCMNILTCAANKIIQN